MAKVEKTRYECSACGASSPKWLGKCPGCGAWSTLSEVRIAARGRASAASPMACSTRQPIALGAVVADDAERFQSGIGELDRVLGGGVVVGGVVLLGGDPGIGKSTLLMQLVVALARKGRRVLYVTGEESTAQVAMRARRIGMSEDVMLLSTTALGDVLSALDSERFHVAVLDSVQTVRADDLDSAAGSVSQVREVATVLTDYAKRMGLSLFMIGHVTKDGALAGPKVLEHLVDTVLTFEGDATHAYRIVRAEKNRFGPAHEVAVFEMRDSGLAEVPDPSRLFLEQRPEGSAGSVVVATAEGHRPLLAEIQALVAPAQYGSPRRVTTGLDANRLAVLLAVLHRKVGVQVLDQDVFANAAGGVRVDEPAVDLAICVAVVSSLRERAVAGHTVVFGEVGLAGELRAISKAAARLKEVAKLGFSRVVMPQANLDKLAEDAPSGLEVVAANSLEDALTHLF